MIFLRWVIVACLLGCVIGGLGYVKFSQIEAAIAAGESYPEHSESVEALTAKVTQFSPVTRLSAEVIVPQRVVLQSEHAGRIVELGFEPGEPVVAGQMLVQLDIASEQARLIGARAEVELAKLDLARAETLYERGNANKVRLDQAQASYDIAFSAMRVIAQTIAQKTILAPFAGVTKPGQLTAGQYLMIGSEVAQITHQSDVLWVDFRLPQFLGELKLGEEIQVFVGAEPALKGQIISRDAEIASDTRTRLYRARIETTKDRLTHGSYVEVGLTLNAPLDVVDLPVSALQSGTYGPFVNLLEATDQTGAFRAKPQTVAQVHYMGERVLIAQGLADGDHVATDGAFKLYPGVLTYVVDDLPDTSEQTGNW